MPSFSEISLEANVVIFVAAAVVVWIAGTRIALFADAISAKTGMGHALMGLLLLGGVTSLPELAVGLTAASAGNAALAVNNILGGVAMQVAILAIGDFIIGHRALTSVVPSSTVLLQGSLNIILLSIVAVGIMVGGVNVLGVGSWNWLVLAFAIHALAKLAGAGKREPWLANFEETEAREEGDDPGSSLPHQQRRLHDKPVSTIIVRSVLPGLAAWPPALHVGAPAATLGLAKRPPMN